jgi:hypothetical protein
MADFPTNPSTGESFNASDGSVWTWDNYSWKSGVYPSTSPYFKRTEEEIINNIFPVNYGFLPGDPRRYGNNVGDGTTDNYAAIQAALNLPHPVVLQPNTTYRIDTGLVWNIQNGTIYGNGATITTAQDITGLTIGVNGAGESLRGAKIIGDLRLVKTGTSTNTAFVFKQVREGKFDISATSWNVAAELQGTHGGTQYNNFNIGSFINNIYGVHLNPSGTGWVNENNFYGGRFGWGTTTGNKWHVYMPDSGSTYGQPNNNKFWGPSFELAATGSADGFYYDQGVGNSLLFPRIESAGTISDVKIKIVDGAVTAKVMCPYLTWAGTESSTAIEDSGYQSLIIAQDKIKLFSRPSGEATTMLELWRDAPNNSGVPSLRIRDLYQDSQAAMGLRIDTKRRLVAGDYYILGTTAGTLVKNTASVLFECISTHTSSLDDEPGTGVNWTTYWNRVLGLSGTSTSWANNTAYTETVERFRVDASGSIIATNANIAVTNATSVATGNLNATGNVKISPIVTITGDATYADNAAGKIIIVNSSSDVTVTFAVASSVNFDVEVIRKGTGNVIIANTTGVLKLNSASFTTPNIKAQYESSKIVYTTTSEIIVTGSML